MNRTHETAHALVAWLLGLECSPTFARLARGETNATDLTSDEEAATQALERFANRCGVDLVERAQWAAELRPEQKGSFW